MRITDTPEFGKWYAVAPPQNYTGAAMTAFPISMKYYDYITFHIGTGAWAGGTAAVSLTQDTNITPTASVKALGFSYQWTGAAGGDLTKTAVVANTFNLSAAAQQHIIVVEADTLDAANSFDVINLVIASPGANNDFYSVAAWCHAARYQQGTPPSARVN